MGVQCIEMFSKCAVLYGGATCVRETERVIASVRMCVWLIVGVLRSLLWSNFDGLVAHPSEIKKWRFSASN